MVQGIAGAYVGKDAGDNGLFACAKVHFSGDQAILPEPGNRLFEQVTPFHPSVD
jgi:hypothetical protein